MKPEIEYRPKKAVRTKGVTGSNPVMASKMPVAEQQKRPGSPHPQTAAQILAHKRAVKAEQMRRYREKDRAKKAAANSKGKSK